MLKRTMVYLTKTWEPNTCYHISLSKIRYINFSVHKRESKVTAAKRGTGLDIPQPGEMNTNGFQNSEHKPIFYIHLSR
jgi:hypothetical protein